MNCQLCGLDCADAYTLKWHMNAAHSAPVSRSGEQPSPGPWEVWVQGGRVIVMGPQYRMADCGLAASGVAQANARLIAAAPELQAALDNIAAWAATLGSPEGDVWVADARAALAKAAGAPAQTPDNPTRLTAAERERVARQWWTDTVLRPEFIVNARRWPDGDDGFAAARDFAATHLQGFPAWRVTHLPDGLPDGWVVELNPAWARPDRYLGEREGG